MANFHRPNKYNDRLLGRNIPEKLQTGCVLSAKSQEPITSSILSRTTNHCTTRNVTTNHCATRNVITGHCATRNTQRTTGQKPQTTCATEALPEKPRHGSWLMAHGPWLVADGSWLMDHGSRLMVYGPWLVANGQQRSAGPECLGVGPVLRLQHSEA